MKRRSFLKLTAASAAVSLLPRKTAAGSSLLIRRDVNSLSEGSDTIRTLIAGVASIRKQGQWTQLARIHDINCAHANHFFFPWHRPYIRHLEWLIQVATGNSQFALPYWNWTNNPFIPDIFFDPNSPLYDASRTIKPRQRIPAGSVDPLTMRLVMDEKNPIRFLGSSTADQWTRNNFGSLEATPHNNVHNWISGDMANMMSPLDPVFWLHHANVDRLWEVWKSQGNSNPTDSAWRGYTLTYGPFTKKVGDILNLTESGCYYDNQKTVS